MKNVKSTLWAAARPPPASNISAHAATVGTAVLHTEHLHWSAQDHSTLRRPHVATT
jgi:hypothetical protein